MGHHPNVRRCPLNAHTPGPWHIRGDDGSPGYVEGRHIYAEHEGNTGCVAIVRGSMANAHLIAAAPEMLAALERLESGVRLWISRGVSDEDMAVAQAAIAKARGES